MKSFISKLCFAVLALLMLVFLLLNLLTGSTRITADEAIRALFRNEDSLMAGRIIREIRLPRLFAAAILGGGLAVSGYLLQTFFRNPIVGPFVLGISSGAKLAVALATKRMMTSTAAIRIAQMII